MSDKDKTAPTPSPAERLARKIAQTEAFTSEARRMIEAAVLPLCAAFVEVVERGQDATRRPSDETLDALDAALASARNVIGDSE